MTAPEPRANPLLLGHEAAEATLAEAMRSGRLHHAWLITGPAGHRQGDAGLPLRALPARRPGTGRIARTRRKPTRCSAASRPARMPTC